MQELLDELNSRLADLEGCDSHALDFATKQLRLLASIMGDQRHLAHLDTAESERQNIRRIEMALAVGLNPERDRALLTLLREHLDGQAQTITQLCADLEEAEEELRRSLETAQSQAQQCERLQAAKTNASRRVRELERQLASLDIEPLPDRPSALSAPPSHALDGSFVDKQTYLKMEQKLGRFKERVSELEHQSRAARNERDLALKKVDEYDAKLWKEGARIRALELRLEERVFDAPGWRVMWSTIAIIYSAYTYNWLENRIFSWQLLSSLIALVVSVHLDSGEYSFYLRRKTAFVVVRALVYLLIFFALGGVSYTLLGR